MGFIDLHSHILCGLDDGAKTLEQSVAMVAGLRGLGFETICATPHQKSGHFLPSPSQIATSNQRVNIALAAQGIATTIIVGAENMWDTKFFERVQTKTVPHYGNTSAFLVEFPLGPLPPKVQDTLFQLSAEGHLPVIAHPERYETLWKDEEILLQLGQSCALVVDLGAVAGYHGRKRTKYARKWLKQGKVHAVASDSHTPADIRLAALGIDWIHKKLGAQAVETLLTTAPREILAGNHPG